MISLYEALKSYTMVPEPTFRANLEIARSINLVPGCIVECGSWKGAMVAAISSIIPHKHVYIFDSFEGLPPAEEIDGEAAIAYQNDTTAPNYHNNCRADLYDVVEAMQIVGCKNYSIIKGWFEDTIDAADIPPIALLRLDADWYASTKVCLDRLYPRVVQGGLIVIDDYHAWEGCRKAVDEFAEQEGISFYFENNINLCWTVKK